MPLPSRHCLNLLLAPIVLVTAQQECYYGPGAANRGPSNLVPCMSTGTSACCLLGDTCLSGNTCYNYATGDLYQYGCTDITYKDLSCPYKCGWNTTLSPWTALEYCQDVTSVIDTWTCHAPESCGCQWDASPSLLILQPRGCKEMGTNARVALYAPATIAPFVSLPSTIGGSTGYYSPTMVSNTSTWVSTAVSGYTPSIITPLTSYASQPTTPVLIAPAQTPSPSTVAAAAAASFSSSTTQTVASTRASTSSTSSVFVPLNTIVPLPPGLSTGAKAGIGVGVAGGVCLVAAIAVAFFLSQKHQRQRRTQQAQYHNGPTYAQSPPMQGTAYYPPGPGDKADWQAAPPSMGGPYMPAGPYYNPNHPAPYHNAPTMYAKLPADPRDELAQTETPVSPPTSPPMELSAEQQVHELGSEMSVVSPFPTPTTADVETELPRQ